MSSTALSRRLQAAKPDDVNQRDWEREASWANYWGDDPQRYALAIEDKHREMIYAGEKYRRKHNMPVTKFDSLGEIVIPSAAGDSREAVKGVGIGAFIALVAVMVTAGSIALVVFVATADIALTLDLDPLFAVVCILLVVFFVLLAMAGGRSRY